MTITARAASLFLLLLAAACASRPPSQPQAEGPWYPEQVISLAEKRIEIAEKEGRLRGLMLREGIAGILLSRRENFAWITAGGSDRLAPGEEGAPEVFIAAGGKKLILAAAGAESAALAEELKQLGFGWASAAWADAAQRRASRDALLRELSGGKAYGSDTAAEGSWCLENVIASLRAPLTAPEIKKYRWLGRRSAEAVDTVVRGVRQWDTDRGIEGRLARELLCLAIRPSEIRVAVDGAVQGAAARKLEGRASIGVSASRWGLFVSLTRTVHIGPVPMDLQRRYETAARMHAGLWARTLPRASGRQVLEGAVADARAAGLHGDWLKEPLGGGTGYRRWEWLAEASSTRQLGAAEALAWHTSVRGLVLEDTVLLTEDRFEVLTRSESWPVAEVRALGRIYRLPAILVR